jgi:hypothetical protein
MEFILSLAIEALGLVWASLQHNWPYLVASVVIATLLKLYVNAEKVSAFLNRYRGAGIFAATTVAVATPLCSCGTTAVLLGMMASRMAWAPIVAFMVASPLTSPEGLVYSAGLFGWPFGGRSTSPQLSWDWWEDGSRRRWKAEAGWPTRPVLRNRLQVVAAARPGPSLTVNPQDQVAPVAHPVLLQATNRLHRKLSK